MRDYKEWTAAERLASLKKTKAAITSGIIPPPTKCNRCGKETGRIDYHNHDYSDPIKHLEQLCQGCHTRLHRMENKEMDGRKSNESISTNFIKAVSTNTASKVPDIKKPYQEKPVMRSAGAVVEKNLENTDSNLNSWLERGMNLPLEPLADHVCTIPDGVKPLLALRGLGIVFCNGFTKLYNCPGYPRTKGIGRNRQKFDIVVERIRFHERNGESLKVKGVALSEKLESNYVHNK